ncbi:MAG: protein kinase [bacterium]|nr:protein kinase [bacterium]
MDRIGKYQIFDKIGSGGFAVVYKGYDPHIKRPVAIKVCYSRDPETRERFNREAEVAGRLAHRHITTVYDFGTHEQMPYLVEEYLSGEDLAHMIRRREPEPLEEKVEYLLQIASGLGHAHSQGVIHRDIKPSNIRVLDNGRVKIMDFGTAKLTNVESNLTQAGMTLGTVAYLSPERLLGQPSGTNSDIFSYGVLAYELLSFRRPFAGRSIPNLIDQVLNASPVPLIESWSECPPQLAEIVHRCLHKDPKKRYAAFSDVISDLEEVRTAHTAVTQVVPGDPSGSVIAPPLALQASGLLERARQQLAAGKLTRAEVLLDEVLEIDPKNQEAQELLAECHAAPATGAPAATRDPRSRHLTPETPTDRRRRKIAEATTSIETYIGNRELVQAAAALKFATQLLGEFEQVGMMRTRIVDTVRNDLVSLKIVSQRQAIQIVEALSSLQDNDRLPVELAETFVELAEDLDPDDRSAREILVAVRQKARQKEDLLQAETRARKQAEAVASIEKLIAEGNPAMAERALRFAVRLLGEFDQIPALELRIAQAQRQTES